MSLTHLEHEINGILIILIGVAGLVINGSILFSAFRKFRPSENRINILILNLTMVNIGIIIFAFPLSATSSLKHKWIWGDVLCQYYGSIALLFGYNMIVSVLMICLDIFLQYCYEDYDLKKQRFRTYMMAWIWLNSIFWSVTPLLGWSSIWYEPIGTSCSLNMMNPDFGYISYISTTTVFLYIIPILLMINFRFCSESITYVRPLEINTSLKKSMMLLLFFIVQWTPYTIVYLWPLFYDPRTIPIRLSAAGPIIAKLSVVLTPLIFINEKFQEAAIIKSTC